ncbi:MAG TPA: helical backbone metal receptor [Candidatus Binataceae bacterium]
MLFRAPGAQARADRIISLTPSVTEILFALGAGAEVVGVSQYCDYPPAALKLPKAGSFLTPNVEAIAALRPTLVIGLSISSDQREIHALQSMGYPFLMISDDSVEQIEKSIEAIGARIGRAEQARESIDRIHRQIESVRERLTNSRDERVLMLVGHQPMIAVGRGTYLDDLLKLARADNIAAVSPETWPRLSVEYIIAMHPDVILDGQMGDDPASPAKYWQRYATIPAVQNHRVYGYPQDPVLHPGPRIGASLEVIAQMIHPGAWQRPEIGK